MLAPRIYKAAAVVGFACLLFGVVLGLCAIWTDLANKEVFTKIIASVVLVFVGAVVTMGLASATPRDPLAEKHKSFKLTVPDRTDAESKS